MQRIGIILKKCTIVRTLELIHSIFIRELCGVGLAARVDLSDKHLAEPAGVSIGIAGTRGSRRAHTPGRAEGITNINIDLSKFMYLGPVNIECT